MLLLTMYNSIAKFTDMSSSFFIYFTLIRVVAYSFYRVGESRSRSVYDSIVAPANYLVCPVKRTSANRVARIFYLSSHLTRLYVYCGKLNLYHLDEDLLKA